MYNMYVCHTCTCTHAYLHACACGCLRVCMCTHLCQTKYRAFPAVSVPPVWHPWWSSRAQEWPFSTHNCPISQVVASDTAHMAWVNSNSETFQSFPYGWTMTTSIPSSTYKIPLLAFANVNSVKSRLLALRMHNKSLPHHKDYSMRVLGMRIIPRSCNQ
jgi:hypothetical protein